MRIALITSDGREVVRNYSQRTPGFGTAPEALMQGFAATPDIEVDVIGCVQQPAAPIEPIAPNIRYHALLVPKIGWLRTAYQGCIRAVRAKLRELKPDIVHGQGTERECAISAAFSGFPNVITVHGNMRLISRVNGAKPFSYQWLAARLEAFTIPRSDGVVCITKYTQEAVARLARRTWVLPNAVDHKFFAIGSKPASPPVILVVGYIQKRKNQNAFIRALDDAVKQTPLRVVFCGLAGGEEEYVREFRSLVEARPWCEHVGVVNRDALRERFATASLLALPSLEDNCPMTVLEAMAAGVPVMAANVGGVPELVEHGKTGLLCNPLSAESMRERTLAIIRDHNLATQLAANANAAAHDRFHPVAIARQHLAIYRDVLSNRS